MGTHGITIVARAGILLFTCLCMCFPSTGETVRTRANITYRIPEGVYVNVGTEAGLQQGLSGSMVLEDGRTLVFEVVSTASHTALLRLQGSGSFLTGSLQARPVELVFSSKSKQDQPASSVATESLEDEPFVPLLAPTRRLVEIAPTQNLSRGNVGIQQAWQGGTDNQLDYAVTRLYSSGNIDRLFGSGMSLVWSGNIRYRTGDGYARHEFFQQPQVLIYSAYMQHPLTGDGFGRAGRFLPIELPGIGYLDGGQLEIDPGRQWRFGLAAGLKPNRITLDVSSDEPTIAGYTTFEAGRIGSAYYSGTAGLLGALYQGEFDRAVILFDQRAGLGPRLDLLSTLEYDFGVANTTNSQNQLTRLDLQVSSRLHSLLTLRAGADHWQRVDTQATRDLLPFAINDELFDSGFWRYWVGGRHELPWNLDLNEELAYIVSDATDDAVRWRLGLTRMGLFDWRFANIGATVYNLETQGASGYGGLLRAYLPMWNGRLSARPSLSSRWLDPSNGGDGLSVTYFALHGDWQITQAWMITGGLTITRGDGSEASLIDLGLRYAW